MTIWDAHPCCWTASESYLPQAVLLVSSTYDTVLHVTWSSSIAPQASVILHTAHASELFANSSLLGGALSNGPHSWMFALELGRWLLYPPALDVKAELSINPDLGSFLETTS